jgi:hypothetical protein
MSPEKTVGGLYLLKLTHSQSHFRVTSCESARDHSIFGLGSHIPLPFWCWGARRSFITQLRRYLTRPHVMVHHDEVKLDDVPVVASASSASAAAAALVRGSSPEPIAVSMWSVTEVLRVKTRLIAYSDRHTRSLPEM